MDRGFAIVHPDDVSPTTFTTSDTTVRKLTEPLGCTELRINLVLVEPGEVTTPHTHPDQEEVFFAITGGQIQIEDEVYTVPEGGLVRVHPETVRNLVNLATDGPDRWIAIGAPPVGTVDDFGAFELPDEEPIE